ncbi:MAG: lysophospholipid acyltransferase family protein [Flavobacteriales bacterium]
MKLGVFLVKLIGKSPFWLLYFLSDFSYFFVYKLFGYRTKVVRTNLKLSFPNASDLDLKAYERAFYKHFFDVIVETLKCESITEKELRTRMVCENLETIEALLAQNQSAIIITGHYNNWEWAGRRFILDTQGKACIAYKRISNPEIEDYTLQSRLRFGGSVVVMEQFLRHVIKHRKQGIYPVLIADQTPHKDKIEFTTPFLNQETAVYLGGEKLTKSLKFPAYFMSVKKLKRGHYSYRLDLLDETSGDDFELTKLHTQKLEEQIQQEPAYWLWSHRRWKYTRKS